MNTSSSMWTSSSKTETMIENFRQARGLNGIYRCANTDGLGQFVRRNTNENTNVSLNYISQTDRFVLCHANLIIDLRSPSERNEQDATYWMEHAPGGPIQVENKDKHDEQNSQHDRRVLRVDILPPAKLFDYMHQHWFTTQQKAMAALYYAVNMDKLHELRIQVLNHVGLLGLYQFLLDKAQSDFLFALQEITKCIEQDNKTVVIHCVKGKDRTGLLVMLCQSIMGLSVEDIVSDYHLSDMVCDANLVSVPTKQKKSKLDRTIFNAAPKQVMESTLEYLENNYGSTIQYLDTIGFHQEWRRRFQTAMEARAVATMQSRL